jgi:hypothetical protein
MKSTSVDKEIQELGKDLEVTTPVALSLCAASISQYAPSLSVNQNVCMCCGYIQTHAIHVMLSIRSRARKKHAFGELADC